MADVVDTFGELQDLLARIVDQIEKRAGEKTERLTSSEYQTLATTLEHDVERFAEALRPVRHCLPTCSDRVFLSGFEFGSFFDAFDCLTSEHLDYLNDNGFHDWSEEAERFLRCGWDNLRELQSSVEHELRLTEHSVRTGGPPIIYTVPVKQPLESASVVPPDNYANEARHSSDFASAFWYGQQFEFTTSQAACVKVLWEAWENKTPTLSGPEILDQAGISQERLDKVFRGHPAWKTMIFSPKKGRYCLKPLVRENAHQMGG